jgi:hypothetical protein
MVSFPGDVDVGLFPWSKPVHRIKPLSNADFERRVGPVCNVRDIAVFDRIEMDVIHMRGEVGIVAYAVLPKTPLPNSALLMTPSRLRKTLIGRKAPSKDRLDQAPAGRKIVVTGRERPDTVEMVGQDHPRIDRKRADSADRPDGSPQDIHRSCQQVIAMPLQEIDREEEASSRHAWRR